MQASVSALRPLLPQPYGGKSCGAIEAELHSSDAPSAELEGPGDWKVNGSAAGAAGAPEAHHRHYGVACTDQALFNHLDVLPDLLVQVLPEGPDGGTSSVDLPVEKIAHVPLGIRAKQLNPAVVLRQGRPEA
jgi:hypothetical protein